MPDLVSLSASVAVVVLAAVLLRNVLNARPEPAPEPADVLSRELAQVLQAVDLTVPRTQELAVMVVALPDHAALVRAHPLVDVFRMVNAFYRVATEIADQHKGEVASLVGGELYVLFGRILPAERPVHVAAACGVQIAARLSAELAGHLNGACRGAAIGIAGGTAVSGPLGGEHRRTYGTVGTPVDEAHRLARSARPGEVRAPAALEAALAAEFTFGPAEGDTTARCVLAAKGPAPETPAKS